MHCVFEGPHTDDSIRMVKRITGRMETISGQVLLVEIMSITGSPGKICYLCSIPHCSKPSEEHTFNVHEIQADGIRAAQWVRIKPNRGGSFNLYLREVFCVVEQTNTEIRTSVASAPPAAKCLHTPPPASLHIMHETAAR